MSNKTFGVIIAIIVIIIGFLGYYIYSKSDKPNISFHIKDIIDKDKENDDETDTKDGNNDNKKENADSKNKSKIKDSVTELTKVTSYTDFFNINNVINKYFEHKTHNNSKDLYKLLDTAYKKNHKITMNNISKELEKDYQDIIYNANEMYYKSKNQIVYFFTKGSTQKYNFGEETMTEGSNEYFLITVDRTKSTVSVYPLKNISSLKNYATNYSMPKDKSIEDNSANTYFSHNYSDYKVGEIYINYFQSILYLNTEKAYNMLGVTTKNKYPDLESFTKDLENIYENILNKQYNGFNVTGEAGQRTYILNDGINTTVTITEKSIMDITIDF